MRSGANPFVFEDEAAGIQVSVADLTVARFVSQIKAVLIMPVFSQDTHGIFPVAEPDRGQAGMIFVGSFRKPESLELETAMTASVETYAALKDLAYSHYHEGTSMFHALTWEQTFGSRVRWDRDLQLLWIKGQNR
jgi:hypothetical protein